MMVQVMESGNIKSGGADRGSMLSWHCSECDVESIFFQCSHSYIAAARTLYKGRIPCGQSFCQLHNGDVEHKIWYTYLLILHSLGCWWWVYEILNQSGHVHSVRPLYLALGYIQWIEIFLVQKTAGETRITYQWEVELQIHSGHLHQSWRIIWLLYQYQVTYIRSSEAAQASWPLHTRSWSEVQISGFKSESYTSCPSNKEQSTSARYISFNSQWCTISITIWREYQRSDLMVDLASREHQIEIQVKIQMIYDFQILFSGQPASINRPWVKNGTSSNQNAEAI